MIAYYSLAQGVFEFITAESLRKCPDETGGILVGKMESDCVLIEHATGPGPLARRAPQLFKRDGEYSQRVLDGIVVETGGDLDYVGEWHSHPARFGPSARDVAAMRWIASNRKYAVKRPIMGLCFNECGDTWRLSFYLFDERALCALKARRR
jgi:integrative and conjugative element protein (TIGR02256 family)